MQKVSWGLSVTEQAAQWGRRSEVNMCKGGQAVMRPKLSENDNTDKDRDTEKSGHTGLGGH